MGIRISSYEISGGHKGWDHSRYKGELALPPPVAVVTHTPLHPHFLHHLAAIPYILSLRVSQVQVSQVSAPSHIQPIQCLPLHCWGPGDLPGSANVSISARFLLSPSLDLHSLGHVETGKMVTRWESSDITDLHGALVAFSWSRRTDLKCPLTNKYFSWGVSGDFPGHSQVGDPQIHGFLFNQGKCSGTTAPHLQYSPQPLYFPH